MSTRDNIERSLAVFSLKSEEVEAVVMFDLEVQNKDRVVSYEPYDCCDEWLKKLSHLIFSYIPTSSYAIVSLLKTDTHRAQRTT